MRPQRGKRKLFDAALRLFEAQGYFATTVEQITAEAGVSKGLVYNYFDSKDALLVALVEDSTERMASVAGLLAKDQPLEVALQTFIDAFFRFLTEERRWLRLQLSLLIAPELRETVAAPLRTRAQRLLNEVHRWFRRAKVPHAKDKARTLLALLDGIALHALVVYDRYPLRRLDARVRDVAMHLISS